jgi:hypothetical protein
MYRNLNRAMPFFSAVLLLFGLAGCSHQEPPAHAAYPDLIRGEWTLLNAYRNEAQTHVLDGTYFRFLEGGRMSTNLPLPGHRGNEAQDTPYQLLQDSLLMRTTQGEEQVFLIGSLDSQRMILSTMILDHAFRFDLTRAR